MFIFDLLFGCWHKNYSFPITAKKGRGPQPQAARFTGTYVVCLDCGKEFPYDWNKMKVLTAEPKLVGPEYAKAASVGFKVA